MSRPKWFPTRYHPQSSRGRWFLPELLERDFLKVQAPLSEAPAGAWKWAQGIIPHTKNWNIILFSCGYDRYYTLNHPKFGVQTRIGEHTRPIIDSVLSELSLFYPCIFQEVFWTFLRVLALLLDEIKDIDVFCISSFRTQKSGGFPTAKKQHAKTLPIKSKLETSKNWASWVKQHVPIIPRDWCNGLRSWGLQCPAQALLLLWRQGAGQNDLVKGSHQLGYLMIDVYCVYIYIHMYIYMCVILSSVHCVCMLYIYILLL